MDLKTDSKVIVKKPLKRIITGLFLVVLLLFIGSILIFNSNKDKKTPMLLSPVLTNIFQVSDQNPEEFEIKGDLTPPYTTDKYDLFLKGEKRPEYAPSIDICYLVLNTILDEYVEPVEPETLFTGVREELRVLLFDAGCDYTIVEKIPSDGTVFQSVLERFGNKIDKNLLLYACIKGMFKALDDPYSEFLGHEAYQDFQRKTRYTDYKGIGVQISRWNNSEVRIIEVFGDTPAEKTGLLSNDIIKTVNGRDTSKLSVDEIAEIIESGESAGINLSIRRNNSLLSFNIDKDNVKIPTIEAEVINDRYGYIKIDSFKEELHREFKNAYISLEDRKIKGLILDLRNNPGGLVESAQELCGFFLPRSSVIASFRNKHNYERIVKSSGRRMVYVPVVVLTNKFSASSSEITIGALKDHGAAQITGTTTRGKGSVQKTFPVEDLGAIKLTVEKIYTPNGDLINKSGIKPHMELLPETIENYDKDIILRESVRFLDKKTGFSSGKTDSININSGSEQEKIKELTFPRVRRI
jgi:carboxyl-terminal processing protease